MDFDEYQRNAVLFSGAKSDEERLVNGLLGLSEEVGEVAATVRKKAIYRREYTRQHIVDELGDVLWFLSETVLAWGFTLDEIAKRNLEKLRERYPDGFRRDDE